MKASKTVTCFALLVAVDADNSVVEASSGTAGEDTQVAGVAADCIAFRAADAGLTNARIWIEEPPCRAAFGILPFASDTAISVAGFA